MKIIVTANETFGPFNSVEPTDGGVIADGCVYFTSVIGDAVVQDQGDWVPPVVPQQKTREEKKADREAAVAAITVTTAAGNTFDGDETSQGRMARAIIALGTQPGATVNWVLADNSVIHATAEELTEALALAGAAQAAIWVID